MAAPRDVTIGRKAIRSYQKLLDRQAEKGAAYVDEAVAAYMRSHPGATVAQVRKFTFELMQDALPNFTDLAETLSCEFMEEVAARHGWEGVHPEIVGTTDYRLVDKRLHWLAKHLADGDAEKYREGVLDATRFYIKRAAQDSMVENCGKANLRFARVPSGFETCAFCFMLASRGFVYRSEIAAGQGHEFHPNCNCTIVPGAKGRTAIDGYDPQGMADRWDACLATLGGRNALEDEWDALPDEEKAKWLEKAESEADAWESWFARQVMAEVETRDWHWLYTGETPDITYESQELKELKERKYPHEIETAKALRPFGVRCDFVVDEEYEEDGNGKRTGNTISYADCGSGYELKTTKGASSYNTINGHLKNASKKKDAKYVVFDNRNNKNMSDGQLVKWINESRTFRRGRVYIIDQQGDYKFIR